MLQDLTRDLEPDISNVNGTYMNILIDIYRVPFTSSIQYAVCGTIYYVRYVV